MPKKAVTLDIDDVRNLIKAAKAVLEFTVSEEDAEAIGLTGEDMCNLEEAVGTTIEVLASSGSSNAATCPWCESRTPPEENDDPKTKKLNPLRCPDCSGVGGTVDFFDD